HFFLRRNNSLLRIGARNSAVCQRPLASLTIDELMKLQAAEIHINLPWNAHAVPVFLRADAKTIRHWLVCNQVTIVWFCTASIIVGAGCYGAAIGSWRDVLQSVYTAIKLPLVILLTTIGNGLLNGMLAPLL